VLGNLPEAGDQPVLGQEAGGDGRVGFAQRGAWAVLRPQVVVVGGHVPAEQEGRVLTFRPIRYSAPSKLFRPLPAVVMFNSSPLARLTRPLLTTRCVRAVCGLVYSWTSSKLTAVGRRPSAVE